MISKHSLKNRKLEVVVSITTLACRKGCNKAASPQKKLLHAASVMMRSPGKWDEEGCHWETCFRYPIQSASLPRLLWGWQRQRYSSQEEYQPRSPGQTLWITFSSTYSFSTGSLQRLASKPNQLSEVSWVGQYYYTHINLTGDQTEDPGIKSQAATTWA